MKDNIQKEPSKHRIESSLHKIQVSASVQTVLWDKNKHSSEEYDRPRVYNVSVVLQFSTISSKLKRLLEMKKIWNKK